MKNFILLIAMAVMRQLAFAQVPAITSFNPASGPIGTLVTISGANFSATATDNNVYFGAVKAVVQSASTTSLTVKVPVGATFQPVSVAVNNFIAYAARPFIVTYAGGGMNFTATSFATATNLTGGGNVTAADLDGDHRTDLIYTSFSLDKITILRNTTAGGPVSFASTDIGGLINPISVKAGDVNGDGLPDLVVASPTQNILYVLKNTSTPGSISFSGPVSLNAGTEPRKIAIGDLDNDGKADIACTRASSDGVCVFRNMSAAGNIFFAPKADFPVASTSEGITIGDLNADGKPEVIATATAANVMSVLVNTSVPGTISFNPKVDYPTGGYPWDVAVADIDGDGKADMLSTNTTPNSISVYRSTGTAPLTFATAVNLPTTSSPRGMELNDLNADGKPDIVTANWFSNSDVCVLKNNSTNGTISFEPFVTYAPNSGPGSVALADLNNDGLTDITSANSTSNSLSFFKNQLNITTSLPQCPALLAPVNNATSVNYGTPQLFNWKKDINATGYHLRITEQGGAYTDVNTTDTFYLFTPGAGINYTWTVTPTNMADPSLTCAGSGFSTCASAANTYNITGTAGTTICGTDSVRIITNATSNIQWFFNNQPIGGATGTSIQAKKDGAYTLRILNGSCYSDPTNTVSVTILPTPVKPLLSQVNDTAFCNGGSVNFVSSVNINNQWVKDNVPINGETGISYTATTTGSYFVRVMNSGSGCYNFSDTVFVNVLALPATPAITVTGNLTFCNGDSVKLTSSAATGYQWFKNAATITGATGRDYYAKEAATYTVKVTSATCTSAASTGATTTVTALPATPVVTATGAINFCIGDSVKLTSSVATGNQWYKNNNIITNATGQDYYAKDAGTYTVKNTQGSCASLASNGIVTTNFSLPLKPTISAIGNTLQTGAGFASYTWYLSNGLLTTSASNQYQATQSGLYKVTVTDVNGCKNTSDNFNLLYTGLNDVYFPGYTIQLYPNPVIDELHLQVKQNLSGYGSINIIVTDGNGKHIQSQTLKQGSNTVYLKHLAPGSYWILLKNGRSEKTIKILKVQ